VLPKSFFIFTKHIFMPGVGSRLGREVAASHFQLQPHIWLLGDSIKQQLGGRQQLGKTATTTRAGLDSLAGLLFFSA